MGFQSMLTSRRIGRPSEPACTTLNGRWHLHRLLFSEVGMHPELVRQILPERSIEVQLNHDISAKAGRLVRFSVSLVTVESFLHRKHRHWVYHSAGTWNSTDSISGTKLVETKAGRSLWATWTSNYSKRHLLRLIAEAIRTRLDLPWKPIHKRS